jgi:tRNA pseudouridine38-40 synthase
MRVALGIEYDGAAFCGWQTQPEGCSVQDALERALGEIAAHRVNTFCAGRTDAAVHAFCQVAHFDTEAVRPLSAWVRGVNAALPGSVSVLWAREVGVEFHARYSATARRYRYFLLNRPQRPGLFGQYAGWFHAPLDAALMREGASSLVGQHDFSAFRAVDCQAKNPVRTIRELSVERRGDVICIDITANAYLQHMVRNIVGSLVYVGCGRQPPGWIAEVLEQRDRARAAPTFSPNGLYLCSVEYASHWGLPETLTNALAVGLLAKSE